MPAYIPHIGGNYEGGEVVYGHRLKARLPAKRVPDAVERWLRLYEAERDDGEAFNDFVERVGTERFEARGQGADAAGRVQPRDDEPVHRLESLRALQGRARRGRVRRMSGPCSPPRSRRPHPSNTALFLPRLSFSYVLARGAAAYRSLAGGSYPRALLALFSRNRRRYGGYVVHAEVAILLIRRGSVHELPDQPRPAPASGPVGHRGRLPGHLRETDGADQPGRAAPDLRLGAHCDEGREAVLHPLPVARNYYAAQAGSAGGGPVRSFFEGEATSEVGRKTTVGGDLWTAMQPDLTSLNPMINGADRRLEKIARGVSPQDAKAGQALGFLQGLAVRSIEKRYLKDPPPADFRVNVNPLVTWIWVGGAIAVVGGLVGDLARA